MLNARLDSAALESSCHCFLLFCFPYCAEIVFFLLKPEDVSQMNRPFVTLKSDRVDLNQLNQSSAADERQHRGTLV